MSEERSRAVRPRGKALPVGSAAIGGGKPDLYRYTMGDLERETGLSARNIRYYITEELLPPAKGRGVGATYSDEHLLRLQAVNALKDKGASLKEIKQKLDALSKDDISAMLHVETAPPEDRWRRVMLHPDLELHVRERGGRDRDYALEKVVETIIGQSRFVIDANLGSSQ